MTLITNLSLPGVKFQSWGHITAKMVSNYKNFKIAETSYTNGSFDNEHEYDTLGC